MPKQLIVTCDDFGVDVAVNEAVEQAFTNGILTSASLMMGGEAVHDAVERARRLKGLGVGLHITLADGRPVFVRPLPKQKPEDIILVGGGVEASAKRAAQFSGFLIK